MSDRTGAAAKSYSRFLASSRKAYLGALATLVAAVIICFQAYGQTGSTHPIPDLYKHFVGTWVGQCCNFPGSKFPATPVQLVITVEQDGRSMRWVYTYSAKGQKGFAQETKFVTLDPQDERMTIQFRGDEKDIYKTQNLDQFALVGLGKFSGAAMDSTSRLISSVAYDLEPTTFGYQWKTTSDGKNFKVTGLFTFTRETGNPPHTN